MYEHDSYLEGNVVQLLNKMQSQDVVEDVYD